MSSSSSADKEVNYVIGGRPVHTHTALDGSRWDCNSPYCNDLNVDPPHKGGPAVIVQGQEPWRGR